MLLVEFEKPIAKDVLAEAERFGAAPHPVGAESKYEFSPMFYRVSETFRAYNPAFETTMIRINPLRSGVNTILRILKQAVTNV